MQLTEKQKEALPRVYNKIKGIKIAMLTTADRATGMLHSRPMATHDTEPDGTLWFFTYANSEKADEVTHKSEVNVCYCDTARDSYVSVSGHGEVVTDSERMRELWKPALKAWFPDGLDEPNIALLKVQITEAEIWDAGANKMVKLLHMAKSLLTGEAAQPGEHEKISLRK